MINYSHPQVVAHRAIKAICERVGIKDLYAKCEGSLNMQHITKAFMLGLLRQKTHQVLADEKKLHLVEMRSENDYFPKVRFLDDILFIFDPRDNMCRLLQVPVME